MEMLKSSPDVTEIGVERVHPLRFAERNRDHVAFFEIFNDAITAAPH